MTRTSPLLALIAAAALAGCNSNNNDHTIVAGPDGDEVASENGPVTLPPSIQATKIYRCKDNSVVYIDWLSDQKMANFRAGQGAAPVLLTAPEPDKPLVAEGYSLAGTAAGSTITLERPGMGKQNCKA